MCVIVLHEKRFMKIPKELREKIMEEMRERERNGKLNGLDGMFLYLAGMKIYPDDIIKKYNLEQYSDCYQNEPDGWEGDLVNQL